jgi:hypothetical protein
MVLDTPKQCAVRVLVKGRAAATNSLNAVCLTGDCRGTVGGTTKAGTSPGTQKHVATACQQSAYLSWVDLMRKQTHLKS